MKTKPLPWDKWDQTLRRFSEWMLVGAITAASLDPIPGLIALSLLIIYFFFDKRNLPPKDLRKYHEIKKKIKENKKITKNEKNFISKRDAYEFLNNPSRNTKMYWISVFGFVLCLIYHAFRLVISSCR